MYALINHANAKKMTRNYIKADDGQDTDLERPWMETSQEEGEKSHTTRHLLPPFRGYGDDRYPVHYKFVFSCSD